MLSWLAFIDSKWNKLFSFKLSSTCKVCINRAVDIEVTMMQSLKDLTLAVFEKKANDKFCIQVTHELSPLFPKVRDRSTDTWWVFFTAQSTAKVISGQPKVTESSLWIHVSCSCTCYIIELDWIRTCQEYIYNQRLRLGEGHQKCYVTLKRFLSCKVWNISVSEKRLLWKVSPKRQQELNNITV